MSRVCVKRPYQTNGAAYNINFFFKYVPNFQSHQVLTIGPILIFFSSRLLKWLDVKNSSEGVYKNHSNNAYACFLSYFGIAYACLKTHSSNIDIGMTSLKRSTIFILSFVSIFLYIYESTFLLRYGLPILSQPLSLLYITSINY